MKPLKLFRERLDYADATARLLRRSREPWWPELDEDTEAGYAAAAQRILYRNNAPYMRVGYALREWLIATQQAAESFEAAEQMWPSLRQRSHRLLLRLETVRSLPIRRAPPVRRAAETLLTAAGHPTLPAIARAFEAAEPLGADDDPQDLERVYHSFCRYRDRQLLSSAARASGRNVAFPVLHPEVALGTLDEHSRTRLEQALRRYRAANLLFSWIRYGQQEGTIDRYPALFVLQRHQDRRGKGEMSPTVLEEVRHQLTESELSREQLDNAIAMVARLDRALSEVDFPSLVEAVSSEGGQDGPQSMIGNEAPINVIPGGTKRACCSLVLALAVGRRKRSPMAWAAVMKRLKAHLIECGGITRLAIVVTDTWDSAEFFEDHFAEFRAHFGNGVRFLFFTAGAVPMRLSPIWVDFSVLP